MNTRTADLVTDISKVDKYQDLSKQRTFVPHTAARVDINEKTNELV